MSVTSAPSTSEKLWTPANVVTLIRICLVPVFVLALLSPWPQWFGLPDLPNEAKRIISAAIFVFISCTDWLDGYLARSRGEVTDFGKFMDPLADKILVAAALIALVELSVLPGWPVLIILAREFIVSGLRMVAASKGEVIAASWYGKAKTVFQIIAIVLFLLKDSFTLNTAGDPLWWLSWGVMIVALILTVLSMLDYLVKALPLLKGKKPEIVRMSEQLAAPDPLNEDLRQSAAEVIAKCLAKGVKIGAAESLTGGLIGATLTQVPGSSAVFMGSIVSYDLSVKENVLHVSKELIDREGAVDEQVACQMAEGACKALGAQASVSATGIAGPGGAEPGKPVGTVWIGCSYDGRTFAREYHFHGDRESVRKESALTALRLLYQIIV